MGGSITVFMGLASVWPEVRLLRGRGFDNCDVRYHLLALGHSADDDQAATRHEQAAKVHYGVGGVLVDGLPLAASNIEGKRERGGFRGLVVVTDAIVVVGVIGSTGEVDLALFF